MLLKYIKSYMEIRCLTYLGIFLIYIVVHFLKNVYHGVDWTTNTTFKWVKIDDSSECGEQMSIGKYEFEF